MRSALLAALALTLLLVGGCSKSQPSSEDAAGAGDRSDSRIRMGLALIEEGHVESAMEQFERLAESTDQRIRPGNEPSWAPELIEHLVRRRRYALADSLLTAAGPFPSRSVELRYLTANLSVLEGRSADALREYGSIDDADPQLMLRVHHEMATLHLLEDRPEAAIAAARDGLRLFPEQSSLRILVAQALRRQGDGEGALAELQQLPLGSDRWVAEGELFLESLDRPDTAVVLLEKALQATPQIPNVRYLLGRALLASGDAARAVKAFRPLAERPSPFEQSQRLLADSYRAAGETVRADSLQSLVDARELRAEWQDLRRQGLEASQANDLEAALGHFDAALDLARDHADLHNDRGAVLARLERWDEAEGEFRRATELAPADPTYLENLARLYHRMGDVERRDAVMERWRALTAPDSSAAVDKG